MKLNNNKFESWQGFGDAVSQVADQEKLKWIDLSFNALKTIDDVISSCPHLTGLYLHANKIKSMAEVNKLSKLKHLRSLTLHGNPIEAEIQTKASKARYRNNIISLLPNLKKLDFTPVTKMDREKAMIWRENRERQRKARTGEKN